MNIFGVGGPELIAILLIMLVVAGPKRMIHWSYILGQYIAKFRVIWSQTVDIVQKEFDEAGVDIKIPKQPPTRQNMGKAISDAFQPVTKPIQETMDEVNKELDAVKSVADDLKQTDKSITESVSSAKELSNPPTKQTADTSMGTWSGQSTANTPVSESESNGANMGTWSSPKSDS